MTKIRTIRIPAWLVASVSSTIRRFSGMLRRCRGGAPFGRSSAFTSLFPTQVGIWSYGAKVRQPIFTGGALRGNLHLAESQHAQALISYRRTIQRAFGDVSDALIGYDKLHQVRVRQQDSVADLQQPVRISTLRYKGGTTTYLEVLDGPRSLYGDELRLAAGHGEEYRSLVELYKALGRRLATVKLWIGTRGMLSES